MALGPVGKGLNTQPYRAKFSETTCPIAGAGRMQEPANEQMHVLDASAISILLDEDAPTRMRSCLRGQPGPKSHPLMPVEDVPRTHTYVLTSILTRDFTRRRHAPATVPSIAILRLEGGLPIGPDLQFDDAWKRSAPRFVQLGHFV